MRREGGKLSSFNWKLVLMAGIFQILTLIFDQIVIQYEEKNRNKFDMPQNYIYYYHFIIQTNIS